MKLNLNFPSAQISMNGTVKDFYGNVKNAEVKVYDQTNVYSVYGKQVKHSLVESLSMVWGNFVAILVGLVILFIASYVLFMKQDIGN